MYRLFHQPNRRTWGNKLSKLWYSFSTSTALQMGAHAFAFLFLNNGRNPLIHHFPNAWASNPGFTPQCLLSPRFHQASLGHESSRRWKTQLPAFKVARELWCLFTTADPVSFILNSYPHSTRPACVWRTSLVSFSSCFEVVLWKGRKTEQIQESFGSNF